MLAPQCGSMWVPGASDEKKAKPSEQPRMRGSTSVRQAKPSVAIERAGQVFVTIQYKYTLQLGLHCAGKGARESTVRARVCVSSGDPGFKKSKL